MTGLGVFLLLAPGPGLVLAVAAVFQPLKQGLYEVRTMENIKKTPWITCQTCINRGNCDWCPYVTERVETPLGEEHIWPEYRTLDDDGALVRPGLLDRFTAPPKNRCPFGVKFGDARDKRVVLGLSRVKDGIVTAEQALDAFESLGMEVDVDFAGTSL